MDLGDLQWVRWTTHFRGDFHLTKWHTRLGRVWGEGATVCNKEINVIASITLEQDGGPRGYYRRDGIENKPKSNICKRCEKAIAKGQGQ